MAGYICHLWLDIIWVRDIYLPAFGPFARWDTMRDRLLFHSLGMFVATFMYSLATLAWVDREMLHGAVTPAARSLSSTMARRARGL